MTDFVIYILKSALVMGLLYLLYVLLFRKETFYHFNRMYILGAMVISMTVPVLDIQMSQPAASSANNFDYVEEAFQGFSNTMEMVELKTAENVTSFPVILFLLVLGMFLAGVRVGFQLFIIYKNLKKYEVKTHGKFKYVLIDEHYSIHSFFNYIFVHKSEFGKRRMKEVLLHEQMHADQLHSIDLLFIGFLSILHWFNPFMYLFKRALVETHEFQADRAVIGQGIDVNQYQRLLLVHARTIAMTGLTSSFNQSIIKNRLKMMNKLKSSNLVIIKYVMVIPVVFVLSSFFAVSQDRIEESISEAISMGSVAVLQDTTSESKVEVISADSDGELITMISDYAIITLGEDDQFDFKSDDLTSKKGDDLYLKGNVSFRSKNNHYVINADNAIYREKERKIYAFTDDYVPSIIPVSMKDAKVTSGFGMRMHPVLKKEMMHNGVDFAAPAGTPIISTANGTVRSAKHDGKYGYRVIVDHGAGYSTSYSQMQKFTVKAGQPVKKGEEIGFVGSSGLSTDPHLHYEVMKDGKYEDPADYIEE